MVSPDFSFSAPSIPLRQLNNPGFYKVVKMRERLKGGKKLMAYTQEITSTVNHLLEVLNERILGYQKAAENVKDPDVKAVFEQYGIQAQQFADELLPFSDKFNASEVGTRIQGDVWRVWMDLKGAITGGNRNSMIEASITGEKAAITNYDEALAQTLNPELKGILSRQLSEIKTACNRIEKFKM
jgi:uncharacterized protein (TIGR02284 family)